jgi:hypothetical protein
LSTCLLGGEAVVGSLIGTKSRLLGVDTVLVLLLDYFSRAFPRPLGFEWQRLKLGPFKPYIIRLWVPRVAHANYS